MLPDGFAHLSLATLFRMGAARAPGKIAIQCDDRALRYRELISRVARLANVARDRFRLEVGDRVVLMAANCIEYPEIVAGFSEAGVAVATLNPALTRSELEAIVADLNPRLIVIGPGTSLRAEDSADLGVEVVELGPRYERLLKSASERWPSSQPPEWATFSLCYTSGTTGQPKGVMLSHRSRALTFISAAAEYGCFGPDHHFLSTTPLHHGAGFAYTCANLAFGGSVDLVPHFDADLVLRQMAGGSVTGVFVVPTMLRRLLDASGGMSDTIRASSLNAVICNATACPQPLKEAAGDAWGDLLHETYGSTEAGIVTNIQPSQHRSKPGSVGRPFPLTEVELRDDEGNEVSAGVIGELFSRSPYLFNGYWNRPDETAASLRDGWVTVGDLATRDEDGYIRIVDRKKDMIITGGVNVYPREVENVIAGVVGVSDVAVVGLPDAEWGERVHAFVVRDGQQLDAQTVMDLCVQRLSPHKRPKTVSFIADLPRSASGKVMKAALRGLMM